MNNIEFFVSLLILIIVLIYINHRAQTKGENFSVNDFPCSIHPFNSNCTCPVEMSQRRIIGEFPLNYGEASPYKYVCVGQSEPEPKTTLW